MSSTTAKRRPSFPSSSSESVLRSVDSPRQKPPLALIKHGKYVVLGGLGVWWTGLNGVAEGVLARHGTWTRKILIFALGLHGFTIAIFLYLVLFLPWFRGYIPNYPNWQQSARLRILVPILTISILLGWTSYVVSLSQAGKSSPISALGDAVKGVGEAQPSLLRGSQGLGVISAMAGTTALYTLTFGVLGFIPAPNLKPTAQKQS